ncbi:hypothetical protein AB0942_01740 [Streptomyces nodosus]|uniref:hypothetical protein n=1 Tax=Streptomyces nodosus TaxID=40318 RepID=UPI0034549F01
MQTRGRRIRFTAVLAVVVLALTGFSESRGHGHSRHSGSGGDGGGCSNSHQDHDSSSSGGSYGGSGYGSTGGTYHHRQTSTPTTGSGTGQPLQDATVKLISCATQNKPYATVEVSNPNDRKAEFEARVTFYDAEGTPLLENSSPVVPVSATEKAFARVALDERFLSSVDHCEANPTAPPRS